MKRGISNANGVRPRGFTLIELMIVIAVLAVIAVIAVPSYQDYVVRSKRAAARQVLMESAQWLERNYTAHGCYDKSTTTDCINRSGSDIVPPASLQRAPSEGRISYAVTWSLTNSGQAFTLTATPCATAGTCPAGEDVTFSDPACGALSLTQTGARSSSAGTVATCWQR